MQIATNNFQSVIEDTLGCIIIVLASSSLLAVILLSQSQNFRDPLHLAMHLTGVALIANCCILATILLSADRLDGLMKSLYLGAVVLLITFVYQPDEGLSYYALTGLSSLALVLLAQAHTITRVLPRPKKIDFAIIFGRFSSVELSLAGMSFCFALWLSRPTTHSSKSISGNLLQLENSMSISFIILLPIAALAWKPLERRFKEALGAFEDAANNGGNLDTLDYQKSKLISHSLSGMQNVHIALITAVILALASQQLLTAYWPSLQAPIWLFPLSLLHVALQMVALCTIRLLFYLERDRELLLISFSYLLLIIITVGASKLSPHVLPLAFGLVLSSCAICGLSVWLLRHRLQRLDYIYFMQGQSRYALSKDECTSN